MRKTPRCFCIRHLQHAKALFAGLPLTPQNLPFAKHGGGDWNAAQYHEPSTLRDLSGVIIGSPNAGARHGATFA